MIETICHDLCFNNESNFAVSRRRPKDSIKALKVNDEIKSQVFSIFKSIKCLFKSAFYFFCFN